MRGGGESTAVEVFSAHAAEYTALRRRLVPGYDMLYGTVCDALALVADPVRPLRVLDLGAGTGLVSAHVLEAFPDARIELLDASEAMLDQARATLGPAIAAVHVADLAGDPLPPGPFDAVVSALAIHHLSDPDKRALLHRIRDVLAPGGVFVNAEQLAGPSSMLDDAYVARWVRDCRALGASEQEIAEATERQRFDRCADLESQLGWLREAGFPVVDALYRAWRFAVYAGFAEPAR